MAVPLFRKIARKILRLYVTLMDKLISGYVGGDESPAFFDAREIKPDLLKINSNFDEIARELDQVIPKPESVRLVHETISGHPAVEGWRVLYIYIYGMKNFENQRYFPRTTRVLDEILNVVDAWFSILEPGKSIQAHRGIYKGFLRYHTAFKVPEDSPPKIRVKDQYYTWKERESVMFDDRHDHEVYNESSEFRLVLIVDVMRPLPWYLHYPNLLAINILMLLIIRPSLKGGSLQLEKDVWEAQRE